MDYTAYETYCDDAGKIYADKCLNTKLIVPLTNKRVDLKHIICHGRPIIVRTDIPNKNKFHDRISIYITSSTEIMILERIDEENHKFLEYISTNIYNIHTSNEMLTIPSPQSTFNTETIRQRIGDGNRILRFEYVFIFCYNLI